MIAEMVDADLARHKARMHNILGWAPATAWSRTTWDLLNDWRRRIDADPDEA
jgi:hypothetical protein